MNQLQSQQCANQLQANQWQTPAPVRAAADILIDKVENGFIITIKNKRWVVTDSSKIANVINDVLETPVGG